MELYQRLLGQPCCKLSTSCFKLDDNLGLNWTANACEQKLFHLTASSSTDVQQVVKFLHK